MNQKLSKKNAEHQNSTYFCSTDNNKLIQYLQDNESEKTSPDFFPKQSNLKSFFAVFMAVALSAGICIGALCSAQPGNVTITTYANQSSQNVSESSKRSSAKQSSKTTNKASSQRKEADNSQSKSNGKDKREESSNNSSSSSESSSPEVIPSNAVGNTAANVINGGFMTVHDGWIYSTGINGCDCLFKQQSVRSDSEKITNQSARCIGAIGGSIYSCLGNRDYQVVKMDLDGNIEQQWVVGNESINVLADCIITSDAYGIYAVGEDNVVTQIYTGEVTQCCVYNGLIYFLQNHELCSITKDGDEMIVYAAHVQQYNIGDDGLFYLVQNKLYNAATNQAVDNLPDICALNICDGIIYFGNLDDKAALYSVPVNGGEPSKLSDAPVKAICVMDGVIAIKWGDTVSFVE